MSAPQPSRTGFELAPDQAAAVAEPSHTVRVIAPAGSGKTTVLTERARHLVNERGISATEITLIAFNKRAQEEMAARTTDLPGLHVRTLNAIGLAIVNGSRPFAKRADTRRTIDEPDVRRILSRLITFPRRRNADPMAPWIEALSTARLGRKDPAAVERSYDGDVDGFVDVFPAYREELRNLGVADFDEQIVLAVEALEREAETLRTARLACRILLVDEFQDLTPAHLQLIRLLAGDAAQVFAVGDDDQTIYGYNGADPAWLIDFADYFPGAVAHALTVNYRCPTDVVDAADRLLRRNRRRVPKVIHAASQRTGLVLHEASPDPVGITRSVIDAELTQGHRPADIAVLTRVNSMLAPVQVALVAAGVPVAGGVGREFLQRTAVRAALAWLRLAEDSNLAASDIEEALRRPSRSLHPRITEWVTEQRSVEALRKLAARVTTEKDADRIAAFADDVELVGRARGTEARLRVVRDGIGLGASVAGLDQKRHGMNKAAQSDDLTALVQIAALAPADQPFERWLDHMLTAPWDPAGVTLSTVHRVKGLEWPTVIVHGASADQFPHALADDVEEERRVFHVALTRGGHRVHVVAGEQASPFIRELTTEPSADEPALRPRTSTTSGAASTTALLAASRPGHDLGGDDAALFEQLKQLRRHLADGKPAYVVFGDSVLDAIARHRPHSLADLGRLKGVGPAKLEQYGQQFVDAVTTFDAVG